MDKIQIAFFFISGFLVSRILIKAKVPQLIVTQLIDKKHVPLSRLIFYLVFLAAILSFFIPNAITVLTLLPVLEIIRKTYQETTGVEKGLPTILALSVIYGANIGGMGSVTATPANGILITFIEANDITSSNFISFAQWLLWGIPLVIIFSAGASLLLNFFFKSWKYKSIAANISTHISFEKDKHLKHALFLTALYFISSFVISILSLMYEDLVYQLLGTSIFITIFIFVYSFLITFNFGGRKEKLLYISDLYTDLPVKGFLFLFAAIIIGGVLYFLDVQQFLNEWMSTFVSIQYHPFLFFLMIALIASFSTEILSNTVVQLSIFVILESYSLSNAIPLIETLLIATLSSTCAFMSPIATGVNGLAFGGVKGVSFKKMLGVGFAMNLFGAVLISFWVKYVVSLLI